MVAIFAQGDLYFFMNDNVVQMTMDILVFCD